RDLLQSVLRDFGQLDGVVNNAGVLHDARLGMVSDEDLEHTLQVNLAGPLRIIQLASRLMARSGGGAVVNVSSIVGLVGNVGQAAYSASKGGLIALTRTAAKELAPLGIRVNAVAPGLIDTAMLASVPADRVEAMSAS